MSQQTQRRGWTVHVEDFETEGAFRDEVRQSLIDAEAIGHRLGGAVVSRPLRVKVEGGLYATVGWVFNWQSFVPAERAQSAPAPQVTAEPLPVPMSTVEDGQPMVRPDGGTQMVAAEELSARVAEGWTFLPDDEAEAGE